MDNIKNAALIIKNGAETIEAEIAEIERSGKFNYPRSKNIRKAAMDIVKTCRDLRTNTLIEFKSRNNKS